MEATALLTKQHRQVEKLFRKLEGRSASAELVIELANELAAHMTIEQELLYPLARTVDQDTVLESYEEHALAEMALKRLLATELDDEAFPARVTALKELIMHHVKEEEEELFPKLEKKLGDERLRAMGKQMKARFDEVVDAGYEAAVPRGFAKTSADMSKRRRSSAHAA
ncbi:MAG: hemerythrin domain-containing protein [Polyangiales bacterium]